MVEFAKGSEEQLGIVWASEELFGAARRLYD